jgi:hypothetical protein
MALYGSPEWLQNINGGEMFTNIASVWVDAICTEPELRGGRDIYIADNNLRSYTLAEKISEPTLLHENGPQ